MPTRFWVKNIGRPSSISIKRDTKRKMGEKIINKKRAKSLLNIRIKRI